jgi:DNA-binding NarL/FixJ family response regulator
MFKCRLCCLKVIYLRSGVRMKYIKADTIFPEHLLKEIQKYVQGELIYIPNQEGVRKKWGENSGYREQLKSRNREIREKFLTGLRVEQLAEEFCLSTESIKRIVYSK